MVIDSTTTPLLEFWEETRLRAKDARSTSVGGRPGARLSLQEALVHVLEVGYGRVTRCRAADRAFFLEERYSSPSAGALYPYEILVIFPGETPGIFVYDPDDGLQVFDADVPSHAELAAAGLSPSQDERIEALILLLSRPWYSMKKYRRRGYAYCHLDVGHTAVNLALYATAVGRPPTIHLRFDHAALRDQLSLEGLCREPLAALAFNGPAAFEGATGAASEAEMGASTQLAKIRLAAPDAKESDCWQTLHGLLSFDHTPCAATEPSPVCPVLDSEEGIAGESVALPAPPPPLVSAWEWRAAILGRRSAKGFHPEPLDENRIGALLASVRNETLVLDAADAPRLGIRLVARNAGALEGVYAYRAAEHALRPVGPVEGDFVLACMRQELARTAAALFILHAPVRELIAERGWSAFAELHFQAAHIAQRVGLEAGRCSVGMTPIGGFDDTHCAQVARLPEGEEALYVLVLGIADDGAVKFDRAAIASSHGYDS